MSTLKERLENAMKDRPAARKVDLAAAAGVTTGAVAQWFSGATQSLKAGPAAGAAAYLGVNALWLAEGRGPMRQTAQPPGSASVPAQERREPCSISQVTAADVALRIEKLNLSTTDLAVISRILDLVELERRRRPYRDSPQDYIGPRFELREPKYGSLSDRAHDEVEKRHKKTG